MDFLGIPPGWTRPPEYFADLLADEDSALLVAESDGRVVGVVHGQLHGSAGMSVPGGSGYVEVDMLAVAPTHRRQGIGRALMAAAHAWAAERGARDVRLTVWEFNQGARAFYEALGYETMNRKLSLHLAGERP